MTTLKPRFIPRLQGTYISAQYSGKNESGISPIGCKVLILTDEFAEVTEGGVYMTATTVDRNNEGAESGVLVDVGPDAFAVMQSGKPWLSRKPVPGDHVYYTKYAGLVAMGNDGKKYRLMDDDGVGAIYVVDPTKEAVNG